MARPTQKEIDDWNARMAEPEDNSDDFEVEIYTPEGHGARMPYSKARTYLQKNFGIDLDDIDKPADPNNPGGAIAGQSDPGVADPNGNAPGGRTSTRYFGNKK